MTEQYSQHFVLISKPGLFVEKIKQALDNKGLCWECGMVKYYDLSTNHKDLDFFNKNKELEYQKEYRILIKSSEPKSTELFLGNLEDIISIHDSSKFKGFQFVWP